MKLNLGCGTHTLEGYENWDRKNGHEVYPLDVPDESAWTIRASHVLEHFSHREVAAVVANWVSKLAPGGCLKIAVPNFETVAWDYFQNKAENARGYIMGGHSDDDDKHGCMFDRADLFDLMREHKLERIGPWVSEINDCASHRYSLNLQGFKPSLSETETMPANTVHAVLAAPRFGPVAHFNQALKVFTLLRIKCEIAQGCYWHQLMCEGLEHVLEQKAKYALSLDYDTIFNTSDVMELYRLMEAFPEADAIASVQSKRHADCALFTRPNPDGTPRKYEPVEFDRPLTRIYSAHFGLTIFRAESLSRFRRPWMLAEPNSEQRWGDGKLDADISFWHRWNEQGFKLYLANRVVVGHMSETIEWPGPDHKTIYQPLRDYEKVGIPAEVRR